MSNGTSYLLILAFTHLLIWFVGYGFGRLDSRRRMSDLAKAVEEYIRARRKSPTTQGTSDLIRAADEYARKRPDQPTTHGR